MSGGGLDCAAQTWDTYASMVRMYKHYNFHLGPENGPVKSARSRLSSTRTGTRTSASSRTSNPIGAIG